MTAALAHCPTALLPAIRRSSTTALITGFVQFTGGDNSIVNNGTFDLRHFADTNGDGVRDTLRVAIADLGAAQTTASPTTERWRSPQ